MIIRDENYKKFKIFKKVHESLKFFYQVDIIFVL
jgi:hypothetical protein